MKKNHLHIVLVHPEIPQNVGSIARLTAATCCRLHLIRPLGFDEDDRNLKRAGLDYWPYVDLEIHDSIQPLIKYLNNKVVFLSKKAIKPYTQIPLDTQLIVFGRETSGLPPYLWNEYSDCFYNIPMWHPNVRSLNLAISVGIVLYDQLSKRDLF